MILLEERIVSGGQRCMFVWGWREAPPGGQVEIVCWAEPAETLHGADICFSRQSSKAVRTDER